MLHPGAASPSGGVVDLWDAGAVMRMFLAA